ncbi:unnamed protein product [Amoebophrya sp. A120]|nr:unnamed protein product [Amoebophrya sp. A120]|eukprot:GSA120T00001562001.1
MDRLARFFNLAETAGAGESLFAPLYTFCAAYFAVSRRILKFVLYSLPRCTLDFLLLGAPWKNRTEGGAGRTSFWETILTTLDEEFFPDKMPQAAPTDTLLGQLLRENLRHLEFRFPVFLYLSEQETPRVGLKLTQKRKQDELRFFVTDVGSRRWPRVGSTLLVNNSSTSDAQQQAADGSAAGRQSGGETSQSEAESGSDTGSDGGGGRRALPGSEMRARARRSKLLQSTSSPLDHPSADSPTSSLGDHSVDSFPHVFSPQSGQQQSSLSSGTSGGLRQPGVAGARAPTQKAISAYHRGLDASGETNGDWLSKYVWPGDEIVEVNGRLCDRKEILEEAFRVTKAKKLVVLHLRRSLAAHPAFAPFFFTVRATRRGPSWGLSLTANTGDHSETLRLVRIDFSAQFGPATDAAASAGGKAAAAGSLASSGGGFANSDIDEQELDYTSEEGELPDPSSSPSTTEPAAAHEQQHQRRNFQKPQTSLRARNRSRTGGADRLEKPFGVCRPGDRLVLLDSRVFGAQNMLRHLENRPLDAEVSFTFCRGLPLIAEADQRRIRLEVNPDVNSGYYLGGATPPGGTTTSQALTPDSPLAPSPIEANLAGLSQQPSGDPPHQIVRKNTTTFLNKPQQVFLGLKLGRCWGCSDIGDGVYVEPRFFRDHELVQQIPGSNATTTEDRPPGGSTAGAPSPGAEDDGSEQSQLRGKLVSLLAKMGNRIVTFHQQLLFGKDYLPAVEVPVEQRNVVTQVLRHGYLSQIYPGIITPNMVLVSVNGEANPELFPSLLKQCRSLEFRVPWQQHKPSSGQSAAAGSQQQQPGETRKQKKNKTRRRSSQFGLIDQQNAEAAAQLAAAETKVASRKFSSAFMKARAQMFEKASTVPNIEKIKRSVGALEEKEDAVAKAAGQPQLHLHAGPSSSSSSSAKVVTSTPRGTTTAGRPYEDAAPGAGRNLNNSSSSSGIKGQLPASSRADRRSWKEDARKGSGAEDSSADFLSADLSEDSDSKSYSHDTELARQRLVSSQRAKASRSFPRPEGEQQVTPSVVSVLALTKDERPAGGGASIAAAGVPVRAQRNLLSSSEAAVATSNVDATPLTLQTEVARQWKRRYKSLAVEHRTCRRLLAEMTKRVAELEYEADLRKADTVPPSLGAEKREEKSRSSNSPAAMPVPAADGSDPLLPVDRLLQARVESLQQLIVMCQSFSAFPAKED